MAFTFCSALAPGKSSPGALDEVVGLAARAAQRRRVGLHAPLADVAVGIEAAVEGDDLDGEALLGEQGDGLLGGIRAPAASGSKLTTTCEVWRLRIATCCSVKAVPLVAITFWIPRR